MTIFWTVLTISLILVEASTAYFVSIWFAGGAFAALISSLFDTDVLWQITIFVIVTTVLLIATKPIVKKLRTKTDEKTNVDALIGKTAVIIEDITDNNSVGSAKIDGKIWSARSKNGKDISKGQLVTVEEINGVKLIVNIKEE